MTDLRTHPTLGVEIEMPLASLSTGASFDARALFFPLFEARRQRGEIAKPIWMSGHLVGVAGQQAVSSVDNGFNNLESALGVIGGPDRPDLDLNDLADLVHRELTELTSALANLGGGIVNLSQHPATSIDEAFYQAIRAPKPIYDYWREIRNWRHEVGIDAKAQNGPTTGVSAEDAVGALNLALLAAPAMIAIFANSPFEDGRLTGLKENRLQIWPRMFAEPTFPSDLAIHRSPTQPFESMAHYLRWMFEGNRAMQALPLGEGGYKGEGGLVRMDGDPSLFAFLRTSVWRGTRLSDGASVEIKPHMRHLESLQFSQFADARIRFAFATTPTVQEFFDALAAGRVEELFSAHCQSLYIEGRACGANFPDEELCALDDPLVAASVVLAPSALQKGLQANRDSFDRLSGHLPWRDLRVARAAAIRDGLSGCTETTSLGRFAAVVVDEAEAGLRPSERWMLAYPRHVLRSRQNGADRAIAAFERSTGGWSARLRTLIGARTMRGVPPPPIFSSGRLSEPPVIRATGV